jgi:hypothetical protein
MYFPVLRVFGSGIRCLFEPKTHIFESLLTIFWVESLCELAQINVIIYNFVIFVATKKGRTTNFFSPLSFVAIFGSEIRDGQKLGSGININIPDPQHWYFHFKIMLTAFFERNTSF